VNRLETRTLALKRAGRRALAPFVMAGDGGFETTLAVLRALERPEVACVELGLPFSDPIADGPVLQAAADRALRSGTSFEGVLALVRELRRPGTRGSALPLAIMSYANPLFVRGIERSCQLLAAAGADGLLVPDLPLEEAAALRQAALGAGLCPIFFVSATTTPPRAAQAIQASRGFVYAIGRFGVTGASADPGATALEFLRRTRALAGELPLAVGFGIGSASAVRAVLREADLAIVGSALVEHIQRTHGDAPAKAAAAGAFIQELARGLA
jgi:tryptophan synthase alpha chain